MLFVRSASASDYFYGTAPTELNGNPSSLVMNGAVATISGVQATANGFAGSYTFNGTVGTTTTYSGAGGRYILAYEGSSDFRCWFNGGANSATYSRSYFTYNNTMPVSSSLTATNFSGGTVGIYIDLDGDGIKELVGSYIVDSTGKGSMPYNAAWNGKPYETYLDSQLVDGKNIPIHTTLGSGTFGSSGSNTTGSVGSTNNVAIPSVTIGANGSVSPGRVQTGQSIVNGSTNTVYTYFNAGGGATSVSYSGTGAAAVTAADIRSSSIQNSSENDRIVEAVNAATASLAAKLATNTAAVTAGSAAVVSAVNALATPTPTSTPSPTPSPTGTPYPTPEPTPSPDYQAYLDSRVAAAGQGEGWKTAPTVANGSFSASGSPSIWVVPIGGQSVNFNPMSDSRFANLASWIRQVFAALISAYVLYYIWIRLWEMLIELHKVQQAHGFPLQVGGEVLGTGVSTNAAGLVFAEIAAVIITAAIVASMTLISTYVTVGGGVGGLNTSLTDVSGTLSGGGAIGEGMSLLDKFFPIQHMLTCMANYLLVVIFRSQIYAALAAIRKFLPA